jgi:hypothetical protein
MYKSVKSMHIGIPPLSLINSALSQRGFPKKSKEFKKSEIGNPDAWKTL